MSVTVREAERADLDTIVRLIHGLAEFEQLADQVRLDRDELADHLFGDDPAARVLIAELDGRPVGMALWFRTFSTFLGATRDLARGPLRRPERHEVRGRERTAGPPAHADRWPHRMERARLEPEGDRLLRVARRSTRRSGLDDVSLAADSMTAKERVTKAKDRASKLLQRFEDRPVVQVAVRLYQRDRQAAGTLVGSADRLPAVPVLHPARCSSCRSPRVHRRAVAGERGERRRRCSRATGDADRQCARPTQLDPLDRRAARLGRDGDRRPVAEQGADRRPAAWPGACRSSPR